MNSNYLNKARRACGTATILVVLLISLMPVCAFAAEEQASLGSSASWSRFFGDSRYETMQAISNEGWQQSNAVVITSAANYPDALTASSFAGALHCPILLTDPQLLSEQTATEIERLGAGTVYVIGGYEAISSKVDSDIKLLGCNTQRIYGQTRQQTAAKVAEQTVAESYTGMCIIATGYNYADALSISPYAYAYQAPIYLTEGDGTLSASTLSAIKTVGYSSALIVGGDGVVRNIAISQLRQCGVISVERKGGADRYQTSNLIADWCLAQGMYANDMGVSTGQDFADALAGAALCGKNNSVLILADDSSHSCLDGFVAKQNVAIFKGYVFGGPNAVSQDTYDALVLAGQAAAPVDPDAKPKLYLFITPHQDDELITMGAYAVQLLDAGENVYVELATDGAASHIRQTLNDLGYCDICKSYHTVELSNDDFVFARDNEYIASCLTLGYERSHILIADNRTGDSELSVSCAEKIITEAYDKFSDSYDVVICTLNPKVGSGQHADHRNLGQAALSLYNRGSIGRILLFVEPYCVNSFLAKNPSEELLSFTATGSLHAKCLEAAVDYSTWDPVRAYFAVGLHSVYDAFVSFNEYTTSYYQIYE